MLTQNKPDPVETARHLFATNKIDYSLCLNSKTVKVFLNEKLVQFFITKNKWQYNNTTYKGDAEKCVSWILKKTK